MDSHVGRPDAVIDLTLTEVPLLEVVTTVLLVSRVDLGQEDHLLLEFLLRETLVNKEIILLMHGTVAALARAREDLETATESGGVEGVPSELAGPVVVTVVHTNGVNLLFVTLDAVGGTNVVTEDPSLASGGGAHERWEGSSTVKRAADVHKIAIDGVLLVL